MVRVTRHAILSVLVCLTVLLAGCSGWGTDEPAEEDPEPEGADDLEEASAGGDTGGPDEADTSGADDTEQPSSGTADGSDGAPSDDETDGGSANDGEETTDSGGDTDESDSDGDDGSDDTDSATETDEPSDDTEANSGDGVDDTADEPDAGDGDDTGGDDESDSDEGDTTHMLAVELLDEGTGEPVEGYLNLHDGEEFLGEQSGSEATWEDLDDGEYAIHAYDATAGWNHTEPVTIDGGDETVTVEVDPESDVPGNGEAETHSLIVHAGEAIAVESVPITLERHSDGATTTRETNESGQVEFDVIDGEYTVSGTDPNGDRDEATVTVDGEDTDVLLGALAPPEPEIHDVTLTVTDAETGEPIEDAVLEGDGNYHPNTGDQLLQVVTGTDGTGTGDAYEGSYDTTLNADGYEGESPSVTVEDDTSLEYELEPLTDGSEGESSEGDDATAAIAS